MQPTKYNETKKESTSPQYTNIKQHKQAATNKPLQYS